MSIVGLLRSKLSIKFIMITMFTGLACLIIASVVFLQVYSDKYQMSYLISKQFERLSDRIESTMTLIDEKNANLVSTISMYEHIDCSIDFENKHKLLPLFIKKIFENNTTLYSVYIGYENGNFYEIINLGIHESLKKKKYNTADTDRWLVIKKIAAEGDKQIRHMDFLDADLNIRESLESETIYNPTKRPWYTKALQTDSITRTAPYQFVNIDSKGVTYTARINGTSHVFGIDVLIENLSKALENNSFRECVDSYLFDNNGQVTASTDLLYLSEIQQDKFDVIYNTSKEIKKTDSLQRIVNLKSKKHLLQVTKIDSPFNQHEYLGIIAPLDALMQTFIDRTKKTFYTGVIVLLISLPFVWYLSTMIVAPILKLAKESQKVKKNVNLIVWKRFNQRYSKLLNFLTQLQICLNPSITIRICLKRRLKRGLKN